MTKQEAMKHIELCLTTGAPFETFHDEKDLTDALALLFQTSKRQIREWWKQKAIKCQTNPYYMVVRVGSQVGMLVKVKEPQA